jgi:hypothetical protein
MATKRKEPEQDQVYFKGSAAVFHESDKKEKKEKKVRKEEKKVVEVARQDRISFRRKDNKLIVDIPPRIFSVFGWSNLGVTTGGAKEKVYLTIENNKEDGEERNNLFQFEKDVQAIITEVYREAEDELDQFKVAYINEDEDMPGCEGCSTTVPLLKEDWSGGRMYTVFPYKNTQAGHLNHAGVYKKSKSYQNLVETTGNSNFNIDLFCRRAEFIYDAKRHDISFRIYINPSVIIWMDVGQDTDVRRATAIPTFNPTTRYDELTSLVAMAQRRARKDVDKDVE